MKNTYTSLGFLLVVFLLNACSAKEPELPIETEKVLPQWYVNPPTNTDEYLYGIGEGKSLNKARKAALEGMVSRLGIYISSRYELKLQVKQKYREYFTKDTSFNLKSEVDKIRISNYEVIQNERYRYDHFIVLVRSNTELFKNGLLTSINKTYRKIKEDNTALEEVNPLDLYRFYEESLTVLNGTFSTLLVLSTLDQGFDIEPYIQRIQDQNNRFNALKKNMKISVKGSKSFANIIRTGLSKKGLYISPEEEMSKKHIVVEVSHTVNASQSHGIDIARVHIFIETKDFEGKTISGNTLDIIGQATQGIDVAMKNAANKFTKVMQKKGIFKVIGTDI